MPNVVISPIVEYQLITAEDSGTVIIALDNQDIVVSPIVAHYTISSTQETYVVRTDDGTMLISSISNNLIIQAPATVMDVTQYVTQEVTGESEDTRITMTAGETLGGHRVVKVGNDGKAYYASRDAPVDSHRIVGITRHAATIGSDVVVQAAGMITEPTWAWDTTQPVFLGLNGQLTQTQPVDGYALVLGWPITATELWVHLHEPVWLA